MRTPHSGGPTPDRPRRKGIDKFANEEKRLSDALGYLKDAGLLELGALKEFTDLVPDESVSIPDAARRIRDILTALEYHIDATTLGETTGEKEKALREMAVKLFKFDGKVVDDYLEWKRRMGKNEKV